MAMLPLVFVTAILSGLDNLQACTAIGLVPVRGCTRIRYAIAFSVAESIAPWFGIACAQLVRSTLFLQIDKYSPLMLLSCGLAMLILGLKQRDFSAMLDRPGALIVIPFALAIDNFFAGAGMAAIRAPLIASVLLIGASGSAMSCAGLFVGKWLREILPFRLDCAAGIYLCILTVAGLLR